MIVLLKKITFDWSKEAKLDFGALKTVATQPPVLRLRDFSNEFTIKYDASGVGLGLVLMKDRASYCFLYQEIEGQSLVALNI